MERSIRDRIEAILAAANDMTIATIREDGFPQATTVSYVSDGLSIYFGCDASSQKASNIARNNKVSLTVNLEYKNWNEIRGLSMGALARRIADEAEMTKVGELMLAKFPQVLEFLDAEPGNTALFEITPNVISVLDYTQGFGHTEIVEV